MTGTESSQKRSCGGAGDSLSEDKDNSASLLPRCRLLFPFTELAVWQWQVENEFVLLVSKENIVFSISVGVSLCLP